MEGSEGEEAYLRSRCPAVASVWPELWLQAAELLMPVCKELNGA